VGKDQIQHLEFARDWATKFNVTYVKGYEPADPLGTHGGARGILKLPEARIQESTAVVPGIDGQKMSKSYGNTIDLFAPDAEIKKRIMSIKTDSTPVEAPKPTERNVLFQLLHVMAPPEQWPDIERSWRAGGKGYGEYKQVLLDLFHRTFDPARRKREELVKDPISIDRILQDGARRARALAAPIIAEVRRAVGTA
jgi:tryptophanyl-tRNA synthetase